MTASAVAGRLAGVRSEAILLRRTDYGDADRVVTLLTAERGRVSLLARSARSSRRRFGAALEPFQVIEVAFADGPGELGTLREARVVRAFAALTADLTRMTVAGEAIERLRGILPEHHPEPRALAALADLFALLDEGRDVQTAAVRFELRALSVLGHAPLLTACVACGRALEPRRAALFSAARGGVVCRACGGGPISLAGATVAAMRASAGAGWMNVAMGAHVLSEAREAVDAFFAHQTRIVGGREPTGRAGSGT